MLPRLPEVLLVLLAIAALSLGCASGPAVISSTPNNVAVEFSSDGTVKSASDLAKKECESHGKMAEFDSVDATASPKTRVAMFNCVSGFGDSTDGSSESE